MEDRLRGGPARACFLLSFLFALAGFSLGTLNLARADTAQTTGIPQFIVSCFDADRDLVTRVLTSECQGKVVTDAEADAIEARHQRALSIRFSKESVPVTGNGQNEEDKLKLVSLGTGFYVDPGGSVLTDYHVIAGCRAMQLRLQTGRVLSAATIAVEPENDLALLHAAEPAPAIAQFETVDRPGTSLPLWLIGYPDQGLPRLTPVIEKGNMLQADQANAPKQGFVFHAPVRHGESGGPILNQQGGVIGAVKAKIDGVNAYQRSGRVVENIGLGIPRKTVLEFLQKHQIPITFIRGDTQSPRDLEDNKPPAYVVRAECLR